MQIADVVYWTIWYHLHNLKNVKNTHVGNMAEACNFTKINTPPSVFFTFFKLYKRYQIAQRITDIGLKSSLYIPGHKFLKL